MDIVIGDGDAVFKELDFYYGAKAIEGASELATILTHSILNQDTLKQVPSAKGIRTNFKKSFTGSFGQKFEIEITGPEQARVLNYLGEDGFFQIFNYYIGLVTGVRSPITKDVAIRWEQTYIKDAVELTDKITAPLCRLHNPVEHQGYSLEIRKRRTRLSTLDRNTLEYIKHEVAEEETVLIQAAITRFNKLTGTGRLLLDNEGESISFSPKKNWKFFNYSQRKAFSSNLDADNSAKTFLPLTLEVQRILDVHDVIKHLRVVRVVLPEKEQS